MTATSPTYPDDAREPRDTKGIPVDRIYPLRRNRDFLLLQAGQLLSNLGTASTSIAYPLLVLALTGSAADAGIVAFSRALPAALLLVPAGLAADRFDRKALMILADVVRAGTIGVLAAIVVLDRSALWVVASVAFVEGSGAAMFSASQVGAVRAVVPPIQLPAAAAAQTGRQATVDLVGPPIGGILFAVSRAMPFVFDSLSYVLSMVFLAAMRTPFQRARAHNPSSLRSQLVEGFRFLWTQPFLRTTAFLFGLGNFVGPGLMLMVVVIGRNQGLSSVQIGLLTTAVGASILLGSFLSPLLRRKLPARVVVLLELWTGLGFAAFLVRPSVYVLVGGMLPTAFVIPSTNSIVHGYRIAITPDRLLGRAESIRATISLAIAPLGPLVAGLMLGSTTERATVAVFGAVALVLAVWGSASSAIRTIPNLDGLEQLAALE
jgi:transmembrane secretion effector